MGLPDLESWTRDADGRLVDWSRPPYREGSSFCPRLPGEDRLESREIFKRIAEYTAIERGRVRFDNDGQLEEVPADPGRYQYDPELWRWYCAEDLDD